MNYDNHLSPNPSFELRAITLYLWASINHARDHNICLVLILEYLFWVMHPQSYIFPIVHLVCTCLSMCFNFIDISSILQIFISIVSHILSALRPLYVWWTSTFTKITYKTTIYSIYFNTLPFVSLFSSHSNILHNFQ